MNLERIALIAARECKRQGVGLDRLIGLLSACNEGHTLSVFGIAPNEPDVLSLSGQIELGNVSYRTTPVTFADMSSAIPAHNVPRAMAQLFDNVPLVPDWGYNDIHTKDVDAWIKSFLDIHPFADGNGRTAWLMRTWLLDQWDYPESLPNYYGDR